MNALTIRDIYNYGLKNNCLDIPLYLFLDKDISYSYGYPNRIFLNKDKKRVFLGQETKKLTIKK